MSGKQFYGVALVADASNPPGVHLALGVAAKAIAGVLQNNPLLGQAGCYQTRREHQGGDLSQSDHSGGGFLDLDVGGTFTSARGGRDCRPGPGAGGPGGEHHDRSARG